MRQHSLLILISLILFTTLVSGQVTIKLQNPSFEDVPRQGGQYSTPIKGWHDCGLAQFPGETPPDIHPTKMQAWEVINKAYEGNTYIGMVTRYNDTWESISQALPQLLQEGKCYSISCFMTQSKKYLSPTPRSVSSSERENFIKPVVLLIWAGNNFCGKKQLLVKSDPVSSYDWLEYQFVFSPEDDYQYITIEAFYDVPFLEAYNGHLLLDNLSPIVEVPCTD